MLAARVYLLRHRIMNLKMGADDIDRLGAANLQDQQAKGETSAVEESSSEQAVKATGYVSACSKKPK